MGLKLIKFFTTDLFTQFQITSPFCIIYQGLTATSANNNTVKTFVFTGRAATGPDVGGGNVCTLSQRIRTELTTRLQ